MAEKLLNVQEYDLPLLTYEAVPRTCMPPLFDRDNTCGFSIYPYTLVLSNRREPVRKVYRSVVVENESLRVTVIPDLGGRVYQIEDRETGAAYLHDNRCVRPVRIPPRWNFLSLGMELNFPYTHSPTGTDPVAYELIRDDEAEMVGVAVGEQEKQWGLSWRAEVRLYRGYRGVILAVRGWNDTDSTRKVQWWSNTAQPAGGDTEFVYPEEPLVAHIEGEGDGTSWPIFKGVDLSRHRNYDQMVGTFHHPSTADWFGIYHHQRQWGLLHLADPGRLPGKKLWSFGYSGATADWTLSMTRDGGTSCEIQSGVPPLQGERLELHPGDDYAFVEIWQPVERREELDDEHRRSFLSVADQIGGIPDAQRTVPSVDEQVPGHFWRRILDAWRRSDEATLERMEAALGDGETGWPPFGYRDLDHALEWAESRRPGCRLWTFLRGVHACALETWDEAEARLRDIAGCDEEIPGWRAGGSPRCIARGLLGRILLNVRDNREEALPLLMAAAKELRDGSLLEEVDALLRDSGETEKRRELLRFWPEGDVRRKEVEASIEIDGGDPRLGLEILMTTTWERHHCRHRRSVLWRQARSLLDQPTAPVPAGLMEDPHVVPG